MEAPAAAARSIAPGTRLVIIRHGEAVSNAEDTLGGHGTCLGLTEHGRRQVGALADRLRRTRELEGAAALYTSVLPRAIETAQILAPVLGGLSVEASCSLCERHVGIADGMTWRDYEVKYGRERPGVDDEREFAPGGESWVEFLDRAEPALYDVMERHPGGLVVIAGHGGIVGTSVVRFLGLPRNGAGFRGYADNSSLTEWEWTGKRWWFVRYNDAAHLDAAEWGTGRGLRMPPPNWVSAEPEPT
ncbi:MAG: histidine phosphatase family protein [Acidimicrobiales bacterium]